MKRRAVAINMPTRVMMVPSRMYRNTTGENMATMSKCRTTFLWQDFTQVNAVDPPKAFSGPIILSISLLLEAFLLNAKCLKSHLQGTILQWPGESLGEWEVPDQPWPGKLITTIFIHFPHKLLHNTFATHLQYTTLSLYIVNYFHPLLFLRTKV